ncbi:MAG: peptidase MA domain-containing protein [Dehalococcoidia bacterium]|nr:peptidase MA domain-containing protein [Dehalococcoidia bacterium]
MKRLTRLFMLSFVLSILIAIPILFSLSTAILAQGEITVISSDAETQFPSTITFSLEAEAASDITDIDLIYRKNGESLIPVSSRVDVDFIPGQLVTASWTWDMLETGGLPPGTEIDYWWLIEDAAGHKLETSPATIAFDDLSHNWRSLASDQVSIFWYEGDLSFIQELINAADEALERLAVEIGVALEQPVKIYIYASSGDLRNALVYPQEWTGGIAFPGYGIVIIGISPDNLAWGKRAIAHEMGHLVVHQALSGFYGHLPVWLDEGLAMDAEGDLRSDLQTLLNEAIAHDTLFSVRSISSSFPTDPDEARLCYAESYSLVQFLIDTYGSGKMLNLLAVFNEGNTYDDAMLEVYGFNVDGLNAVWRGSLGLGPQPSPIPGGEASGFPALYIVLVAIVVILSVVPIYLALSFRRRFQ